VAIDTANRRASTIAGCLGFLLVLPAPDATISAFDRAHVLDLYAGELTGTPSAAAISRLGAAGGVHLGERGGVRLGAAGGVKLGQLGRR
jgi:hypothetical protein